MPKADVGIVTIKPEEYDAVAREFPALKEYRSRDDRFHCDVVEHEHLKIAIARTFEQGPAYARETAEKLISEFEVPWILVVGICGAIPDGDRTLGDIMVSSRMLDFSLGAVLEGGKIENNVIGFQLHDDARTVVSRLQSVAGSLRINWDELKRPLERYEAARNYARDVEWKEKVEQSIDVLLIRKIPSIKGAPNATSYHLVKSTQLAKGWKESARALGSVEMELTGVAQAVQRANSELSEGCRLLGIRSVSDLVGYKRSDAWTNYACNAAALFAKALITQYQLPLSRRGKQKIPRKSPSTSQKRTTLTASHLESLDPSCGQPNSSIAIMRTPLPEVVTPSIEQQVLEAVAETHAFHVGRFPTRRTTHSSLFWINSEMVLNKLESLTQTSIVPPCLDKLRAMRSESPSYSFVMIGIDAIGSLMAGMLGPALGMPVICTARDGDAGAAEIFRRVDEDLLSAYYSPKVVWVLVTDVVRTGEAISDVINEIRTSTRTQGIAHDFQLLAIMINSDIEAVIDNLQKCSRVLCCCNSLNFLVVRNDSLPEPRIFPPAEFIGASANLQD